MTPPRKHSDDEVARMVEMYRSGRSLSNLALIFDCSLGTIFNRIKSLTNLRASGGSSLAKINTCFDEITPESAYWIGFIAADGHIRDNDAKRCWQVCLKLGIKDELHLREFIKFAAIEREPIRRDDRFIEVCLCSKYAVRAIQRWIPGGNKSKRLFLPQMDVKMTGHYLRGFFDGDGWVSLGDRNRAKVGIVGIGPIIEQIHEFYGTLGIKSFITRDKRSNAFSVMISNRPGIGKFYEACYGQTRPRLDRKWLKIESALSNEPKRARI